ncbi:MAG: DMT family transporter [Hyphomicrobiaceae bacterium]
MGERASDDLRAAEHADAARVAAGNLTGIIALTAAMASFACGDTLMKLAAGSLPTSELLFIRGLCVTTVSVIAALWLGAFTELRAAMSTAMALRAAGDVGGGWFFQSGLARMAYPDLMAITQLNPLTITAASALFLGDKVGWRRWTATCVGLLGVLIIIQPGSSTFNWWALAGIASVLAATVRDLATRRVDRRVPPILIMTLSAAAVTVASLVASLFVQWEMPSALLLAKLGAASMFSLTGQLCVIVAMRSGEVSAVAPFRYTIILFAIVSGIVIFDHFPDAPTLAGIVIVAAAGLYTFFREQKLRRLAMAQVAADRQRHGP